MPNPLTTLSNAIASRSVLTIRGVIALLAGVLLILVAWLENDLAASVLGPTLVGICLIVALLSFFAGRKTAQSLTISLAIRPASIDSKSTSASGTLYSSKPVAAEVFIEHGSIPPTFALGVITKFSSNAEVLESISIRTSGSHQTFGAFPHRGNWEFLGAQTFLTDPLTLSERTGFVAPRSTATFRVEPLQTLYPWSIVSSVERAGDTTQISTERLGARLDLKTYHPADGMRSIAWKIFARRGELLARHPEAASTPEGTVVIFVAATKTQDDVAGAAVAYARRCEEIGSIVISGALGSTRIVTTANDLLDLAIDSAFDASVDRMIADFSSFITAVIARSPGGIVRKIAIVVPEFVANDYAAALKSCSPIANNSNITLLLLVVPKEENSTDVEQHALRAGSWFFEPPDKSIIHPKNSDRAIDLGIEIGGER